MRALLILLLMPLLLKNQAPVTLIELETSFTLEAEAFNGLFSKRGFKLSATFKDPIRSDRDISMYDKGDTPNDYSSIKKTTHNGRTCSVEYSSYLEPEHDSILKQALSQGYSRIIGDQPAYKKGKFILTSSSFPDFTGRALYTTIISDQTIIDKIGG